MLDATPGSGARAPIGCDAEARRGMALDGLRPVVRTLGAGRE